jgi:3-phosphoshikimate 1-carboxyvinyltransferase
MRKVIVPAGPVRGAIALPGDKSISHRYAMIASIAEGRTRIRNYSTGADCHSTLGCVRALGIGWKARDGVRHPGPRAGRAARRRRAISTPAIPARPSACSPASWPRSRSRAASSATNRSRAGPCGASCSRSPKWGPSIGAREGQFPPLEIPARPAAHRLRLPVASAQVKTCVLFAGLFARGGPVRDRAGRARAITPKSPCANSAPTSRSSGAGLRVGRPRLTGRELTYRPTFPRRPSSSWPRCWCPVRSSPSAAWGSTRRARRCSIS